MAPDIAQAGRLPAAKVAPAVTAARDPRLDFFRGINMFIILIAHVPSNWLTLWIPARFGFSDATEAFVFCSGAASAIAFGRLFEQRGMALGTARVGFRIWQVYWAHIGLFMAIAATMAMLNGLGTFERDYVGSLNLHPFFNDPLTNLPALLGLFYVPNYFDILPMYLVLLALMPLVIWLAGISRLLALVLVAGLWLIANIGDVNLPAEPWSDRQWFFNPLGWQLIFFTGFAFSAGWIPKPPVDRRLVAAAAAIVLITVPFAYFRIINAVPEIGAWRSEWRPLIQKSDFGILRYVHFLAVAYLAWVAAGEAGHRLLPPRGHGMLTRAWRACLAMIMKVGQQSLAVFIASMFMARLMGVALDQAGRSNWTMLVVNLTGILLLILVAHVAGWFKSHPWRKRAT
ncbi:OpgC domain-containing protein [Paracoccus sp. C2R09]|nr:OpgC domain-containing protein [Paracoccus sp. C2R09]